MTPIKTDLDHLPEQKQHYVNAIRKVILNEFDRLIEASSGKKKLCKIKQVILFGSYTHGTYIDDPANGYISDYDILITLNNDTLIEEYELWRNIEEKAERAVHSPINLIVHTADEVGQWLSEGQYFFSDIQQQDSKFNRRCFDRLKRAYVDARYSEHYKVTEEELSWLSGQVTQLKQVVEQACKNHIATL